MDCRSARNELIRCVPDSRLYVLLLIMTCCSLLCFRSRWLTYESIVVANMCPSRLPPNVGSDALNMTTGSDGLNWTADLSLNTFDRALLCITGVHMCVVVVVVVCVNVGLRLKFATDGDLLLIYEWLVRWLIVVLNATGFALNDIVI